MEESNAKSEEYLELKDYATKKDGSKEGQVNYYANYGKMDNQSLLNRQTVAPPGIQSSGNIPPKFSAKHSPIPGKPRQVKALAMKALSAQKRAARTNICCFVLCPFLIVSFVAALGKSLRIMMERSTPIKGKIIFINYRVSLLLKCACNE